jgi:hypothetical protein
LKTTGITQGTGYLFRVLMGDWLAAVWLTPPIESSTQARLCGAGYFFALQTLHCKENVSASISGVL